MSTTPDDKDRMRPDGTGTPQPPDARKARPTIIPPDDAIDFGADVGEGIELSGTSVVDWGSLVEAPIPPTGQHAAIGSSSDADLIRQLSDPTVPVTTSGEDMFEAVVDLDDPTIVPPVAPSDSAIDIGADMIIEESGVALGGPAPADSAVDLMQEDVIVEELAKASGDGSGRDLIAEGLESGVDLLGRTDESLSNDDAIEEFLAHAENGDQTSSVDLGSMHSIPTIDLDSLAAAAASAAASGRSPASRLDETTAHEGPAPVQGDSGIDFTEIEMDTAAPPPAKTKPAARTVADEDSGGIDLGEMADDIVAEEETPPPVKQKPAAKKKPVTRDEEEAEEDEAPTKPAKKEPAKKEPARKGGGMLVGTLAGTLLGAAACFGVWMGGIEPPNEWREAMGTAPKKKGTPGPIPGDKKGGDTPAPVVSLADKVRSGDLDKVAPADLDRIDEGKPAELVARANARWLLYLRTKKGKGLKAGDDEVKKALADLDKAIAKKDPDALFQRGQIHRMTGNADAAIKDFEAGLEQFKADAEQRERFEAALDDLPKKTAMRGVPGLHGIAILLALGFQDDGAKKDAPPKDGGKKDGAKKDGPAKDGGKKDDTKKDAKIPPEAYPMLVKALRLASEKKFKEAGEALDLARARHDERRFLFPNRPQNPRSDPNEDGFLKTCDELKKSWALLQTYHPPEALAKAEEAARAALMKEVVGKLVKDKPAETPEDLAKLIGAERKASADKIKALEGDVESGKKEIEGLAAKVKDTEAKLADARKAIDAGLARAKTLMDSGADALAALKGVGKVVGVEVADLKAAPALLKAVTEIRGVADMKDPKGDIRRLETELAADRETLKNRWTPAQMLDAWQAALADRSRADLRAKATQDAKRVAKDPKSSPEEKARALAIEGLALRNAEKFAEAKATLEKAIEGLPEGNWKEVAEAARREAADPFAGAVEEAERLAARGKAKDAMAMLKRAIDGPGENKAALVARRGMIALEDALARGPLSADDDMVQSAAKDAAAAAKAGSAEGHYLLGRLAEAQGRSVEAEAAYRAAMKADPEDGGRYRVALARLLVKRATAPAPRPVPPDDRMGAARLPSIGEMLLMAIVPLQGLPVPGAEPTEAEKLADQVLALPADKVPFDVRAQALAVKGLHTRALRAYIEGLAAKGLIAPAHGNNLKALLDGNPSLRRPDAKTPPDPLLAEKAYGAGLNAFFAKRYEEAEREFAAAVENDNGDARYYYFLGLARLARGDRAHTEDFDQGAALERLGRPGRAAVSQALERVQGRMREALNAVRSRPAKDSTK